MTHRLAAAVLLAMLTGCAQFRASNQPLAHWDPGYGYRPPTILARRQIGDVLLLLAFSGGGTRAAALAYGVLQELRDTPIGNGRRLLDEVDAITSVSGGSFTSAYYGLYGDRIFTDFEARFLRRNVQRRVILGLLNPINWFKLLSPFFDRSDVAIAYYDDNIFEHATFADLLAANGPLLEINATDLGAGHQFTFYQPQFDLLCSDLTPFKVARAVASSSAVPGLFSPIVLRNYAGSCGFRPPPWLDDALHARKTDPPRFRMAKIVEGYLDVKERPYVDLLDGGIADNLGLRVPLDNVALAGGPLARADQLDMRINSVAVIVVNAEVHPPPRFDLGANAPGLAAVLGAVSDTQIYGYNFDTIQMMRESLRAWAHELPPARDGRPVRTHMVDIGFELIEDEKQREYFEDVPTSFTLPRETVDRLIAVARQLLRESSEYQALRAELGGSDRAAPPR